MHMFRPILQDSNQITGMLPISLCILVYNLFFYAVSFRFSAAAYFVLRLLFPIFFNGATNF